jgi:hypothetical protein
VFAIRSERRLCAEVQHHLVEVELVEELALPIFPPTHHRRTPLFVGLDKRGAFVLRTKVSRSQFARRLVNLPRCLVGLEAGCGAHHCLNHGHGLSAGSCRRG